MLYTDRPESKPPANGAQGDAKALCVTEWALGLKVKVTESPEPYWA